MLAQISQIFGEDKDARSISDRQAMAEYLRACLDQYVSNKCEAPELGEAFAVSVTSREGQDEEKNNSQSKEEPSRIDSFPKGNLVIRRVVDDPSRLPASTPVANMAGSQAT